MTDLSSLLPAAAPVQLLFGAVPALTLPVAP